MRILVATDGSEAGERAVDLAVTLTKSLKGSLEIVHIVSLRGRSLDELDEYARGERIELKEALNLASRELLREAKQRAGAAGLPEAQTESLTESRESDVAESIIEAARRTNTDLIVLGRRGLGRISGLFLGSVSQKVSTLATCPVIVVP